MVFQGVAAAGGGLGAVAQNRELSLGGASEVDGVQQQTALGRDGQAVAGTQIAGMAVNQVRGQPAFLEADLAAVDILQNELEQTRALVAQPDGEPVGKRIDFLLQEIHRETNTIAAKAADLEVTRLTLELKSETEKVREQVQNLE